MLFTLTCVNKLKIIKVGLDIDARPLAQASVKELSDEYKS